MRKHEHKYHLVVLDQRIPSDSRSSAPNVTPISDAFFTGIDGDLELPPSEEPVPEFAVLPGFCAPTVAEGLTDATQRAYCIPQDRRAAVLDFGSSSRELHSLVQSKQLPMVFALHGPYPSQSYLDFFLWLVC
jgi:hypothetical protein